MTSFVWGVLFGVIAASAVGFGIAADPITAGLLALGAGGVFYLARRGGHV